VAVIIPEAIIEGSTWWWESPRLSTRGRRPPRGGRRIGLDVLAAPAAQNALVDLKVLVWHQSLAGVQLLQGSVGENARVPGGSWGSVTVAEGTAHEIAHLQTLELATSQGGVVRGASDGQFVQTLSTPNPRETLV